MTEELMYARNDINGSIFKPTCLIDLLSLRPYVSHREPLARF